jgi:hypothetical protein
MRTEGNVSKVALCKCGNYFLAGHVDYLSEETEKEFTEFTNEGYEVKLETIEETKARDLAFYSDCSKGLCKLSPEKLVETNKTEE